jgi:hypothetical protein
LPADDAAAAPARDRILVSTVVALSLVLGFAVAQVTGVRWVGGVVLVVGGLWCALRIRRQRGIGPTVLVGVVYVAAFAVSHPLGAAIGTWPAVLVTAGVSGAVAYAVMRPTGSRVSTTAPPTRSTR